ncbi:hypothetical protein Pryu01_00422 [Paraliobacillus ryukyuensis]|uniref:LysM domain-containing protein n=1 Tax=Paraliobacillus ryukyuensis TaxID=200904 RepID=A0A366EHM6_9BACI|nr:LysM domain-containing protein [Paraliobacillus ryukyuensis]RBP01506.1 hypothetical protein DES48_101243 [Paraliobacillus ryukyuensis]
MTQHKDQAENLRRHMEESEQDAHEQAFNQADINVLDLPPRSEVHQNKKKKTRWKFNQLFLRFLIFLFVLVIILVVTYPYWGKEFLESTQQDGLKEVGGQSVQVVSSNQKLTEERTVEFELDPNSDETIELTGRYYRVSEGDTLESIVNTYYKNPDVINVLKKINQLEDETIKPGEELFLPQLEESK